MISSSLVYDIGDGRATRRIPQQDVPISCPQMKSDVTNSVRAPYSVIQGHLAPVVRGGEVRRDEGREVTPLQLYCLHLYVGSSLSGGVVGEAVLASCSFPDSYC